MLYSTLHVFFATFVGTSSLHIIARYCGLLTITDASKNTMKYLVGLLKKHRNDYCLMLQNDNFHCDAHWNIVRKMTKVTNPYDKFNTLGYDRDETDDEVSDSSDSSAEEDIEEKEKQLFKRKHSHGMVYKSTQDYIYDLLRHRLLKILRLNYGKNVTLGFLTDEEARVLVQACDDALKKRGSFIEPDIVRKHWEISPKYSNLQKKLDHFETKVEKSKFYSTPITSQILLYQIYQIRFCSVFKYTMELVLAINVYWISRDLYYDINAYEAIERKEVSDFVFFIDCVFIGLYGIELLLVVVSIHIKNWARCWEFWLFALIEACSIADVALWQKIDRTYPWNNVKYGYLALRFARVLRFSFDLLQYGLRLALEFLNFKIRKAFNVGKGFVQGEDEMIVTCKSVVKDEKVQNFLLQKFKKNQLTAQREISVISKEHERLILSIKTRNAVRTILNKLTELIQNLRSDGILDHKEEELLINTLQAKVKEEDNITDSLDTATVEDFLKSIVWVKGDEELIEFLKKVVQVKIKEADDYVIREGEEQDGIIIIIKGLVKVFTPSKTKEYSRDGSPVSERNQYGEEDKEDDRKSVDNQHKHGLRVLGAGKVLGEVGFLTNKRRAADVVCQTAIEYLHVPAKDLTEAINKFPKLERHMWGILAARKLAPLYAQMKQFRFLRIEAITEHIYKGEIVILKENSKDGTVYYIDPEEIENISVVYGVVTKEGKELKGPAIVRPKVGILRLSTHRRDFAILHVDHKHRHTVTKHDEDHSQERVRFDTAKKSHKKSRNDNGKKSSKYKTTPVSFLKTPYRSSSRLSSITSSASKNNVAESNKAQVEESKQKFSTTSLSRSKTHSTLSKIHEDGFD